MRVDVMTSPKPLRQMGELARRTLHAGFDGMLFTEGGRTAYPAVAAAALTAPGLELSTGIAVAFPRSPMISAQVAWELQEASDGSFRLGLGTQVRTHVVRRYGTEFDRPGPRLRDYVLAVKACFAAFRGAPLDHHGEFYELTFLNPQWSPGPIAPDDPKVDIAAVNPWMLRMAGEVADGVHVHPIGEPGYLERHVLPNVAEGAARAGRTAADISLIVPVTTIVGDTDEEIEQDRRTARQMLSFYGSTPNYAFIWDEAGFDGTTARIREKQKAGDFAGMAAEITDDHLATFCTEASWDELADHADRQVRALGGPPRAVQRRSRDTGSLRAIRPGGGPDLGTDAGVSIRRAGPDDLQTLVELHQAFCAVDDHPFDATRVTAAFQPLLADDDLGVVWLIDDPGAYAVVTWGWSIEAGGAEAVLDEIYVSRPGNGVGGALIEHLLVDTRSRGHARVFLESERANERSRRLYARHGFVEDDSIWMSHEFTSLA